MIASDSVSTDACALLPDVSLLSVEVPYPAPVTQEPSSSKPPTLNAGVAQLKVPKPDGPKRSDPFQFGSRFLLPGDNPMDFNAWDHVEVDDDYKEYTRLQIDAQRSKPVSDFDKKRFNADPAKWWDLFYKNNRENFFKDRRWLQQEFPILSDATSAEYGRPVKVVELGCGAGNTLFPVLQQNRNPDFYIHGCDFSAKAVDVVKQQALFKEWHPKGNVEASVYDLAAPDTMPQGVEPRSVDLVIMVFVFSALAPEQWVPAMRNIRTMLKMGGKVLFRDYGRGDLAQVRFKAGRYIDENFYVRGDGTRVYFFDESELRGIFTGNFDGNFEVPSMGIERGYGGFQVESLGVDKRMLVNRKKQIKMYRRWMQAVFQKI